MRGQFAAGLRNIGPLLRWQLSLARFLWAKRREYDVIKCADFDTVLPALVIGRTLRKALVYDIYDFYADSRYLPSPLRKLAAIAERWVVSQVDAVILPDWSRTEQLGSAQPRRLDIICNTPEPLTAHQRVQSRSARLVIGYVGSITKIRGLWQILDVLERHPDWHFEVAGYGADPPELLKQMAHMTNVTFHGRLPFRRALELYSSADVVLCTYDPRIQNHRVSSPNKLAEALMLGKPLVVARGTGIDKIVEDEGVGCVVTYGDPDDLDKAMDSIAAWSSAEADRFARHARHIYNKHYSWHLMGRRTIRLFESVASISEPAT